MLLEARIRNIESFISKVESTAREEREERARSVGRGRVMGRQELEMYTHPGHNHMSNYTESSTSRSGTISDLSLSLSDDASVTGPS